jgi:GGDEF domain-containing protein
VDAISGEFTIAGQRVSIGASIGLSLSRSGRTADELLLAADGAAYRAKHDGRRRVSRAA